MSAIDGAARRKAVNARTERQPPWLRSLKARAILLAVLFFALPFALFLVFQQADRERQAHLIDSIRAQSLIIGHALAEIVLRGDVGPLYLLSDELERYASDGLSLRLLLKPADDRTAGFSLVAAAPKVETTDVDAVRRRLNDLGILDRLGASCAGDTPLAERVDGRDGNALMVMAVVPVNTARGCFALIVSNNLLNDDQQELVRSYWQAPELRVAGAIYFAFALLVLIVVFDLIGALSGFARSARDIAAGRTEARFLGEHAIPELRPIAGAIDDMVSRLREGAGQLRDAAEEMMHAFKTPIGTVRQAAESLRRRIDKSDERSKAALEAIDNALDRLDSLVTRARRLDENAAYLLEPSTSAVSLADLIETILEAVESDAAARDIELTAPLDSRATILHGANLIAASVEQLVDNALTFSPPGSTVTIAATVDANGLSITVRDQGPGVEDDRLDHLFSRGVSLRPPNAPPGLGLGLWVVKRNLTLLHGAVTAVNAPNGGFSVTLEIPPEHFRL